LLPCGQATVVRGPTGTEVAFALVDPLKRVADAAKSQEFEPLDVSDDGALPSSEQSLVGLGRLQELHNGIDAQQHINKHEQHIDKCDLLPRPDGSTKIHGGSGTEPADTKL
jgi:hypothetical protein